MTEPRWLDAVQQRGWRAYVDGSRRLNELLERGMKAKHGLTMPEYDILVRLSEAPERTRRMAELADSSSQSRSRLSHTVTRLEARGYVCRGASDRDRRGVEARLTYAGFEALDSAAHDHVTAVREFFIDLVAPEELETIGRVFRRVADKARQPR